MGTAKERKGEIRLGYHFTTIPDAVIDDDRLSTYAKMVYIVLARHANKEDTAFPGMARIAAKAGCSRPSVKRAVGELEALGYINHEKRVKAGSKELDTNLYTLLAPPPPRVCENLPLGSDRPYPRVCESQEEDSFEVDKRKDEEEPAEAKPSASPPIPPSSDFERYREEASEITGFPFGDNPKSREAFTRPAALGIATRDYLNFVWNRLKTKRTGFLIQALIDGDYEADYLAGIAKAAGRLREREAIEARRKAEQEERAAILAERDALTPEQVDALFAPLSKKAGIDSPAAPPCNAAEQARAAA